MLAGFVHGVLNTDNMNITGESFDYGPYRFLPVYDPSFTAAYFDQSGLYAYGRQPEIVLWNLEQLASALATLVPAVNQEMSPELLPLQQALEPFSTYFNDAMLTNLQRRLGIDAPSREVGENLIRAVFEFLFESKCGFQQFFFDWYGGTLSVERATRSPQSAVYGGTAFEKVQALFQQCDTTHAARRRLTHPYFARRSPCDLLIDEVEAIWKPIAEQDDWSLFHAKIEDVRSVKELMRDGI